MGATPAAPTLPWRERLPWRRPVVPPRLLPAAAEVPPATSLGADFPTYRKLYDFSGETINAAHAALAALPARGALIDAGIAGFLRPSEALTLYECAHFAAGPVLELGSAWGLSTTILCRGVRDAGARHRVTSVEIDPAFARLTRSSVAAAGVARQCSPVVGDAADVTADLCRTGRRFALAFVDHDHRLAATRAVADHLPDLIRPGGLALFHDFNDARNVTDPDAYGVYHGVAERLAAGGFRFLGVHGSMAVLQREAAAP